MVISFNHDTPWKQLTEKKNVVTFRKKRRKNPNCQTWCNRGRGQSKEFDVQIQEIGMIEPTKENLKEHVDQSGFNSVDEWRSAIADLNGEIPETGWLYTVRPDTELSSPIIKSTNSA